MSRPFPQIERVAGRVPARVLARLTRREGRGLGGLGEAAGPATPAEDRTYPHDPYRPAPACPAGKTRTLRGGVMPFWTACHAVGAPPAAPTPDAADAWLDGETVDSWAAYAPASGVTTAGMLSDPKTLLAAAALGLVLFTMRGER